MYILLYLAAIKLRYSKPNINRAYKIPFGNFGMWVVALLGIFGAVFAIAVGLFPPSQLTIGSPLFYTSFLIIGALVLFFVPMIIISFRKPSWKKNGNEVSGHMISSGLKSQAFLVS